ncbi:MAG: cytochrome c [Boseongicola sp. SB0675_bin_26]|nr:cytochrome c [Boseongicola sp. SB0675_bin_26]
MRIARILFILVGIGGLAYWLAAGPDKQVAQTPDEPTTSLAIITVPESLSSSAQVGRVAFEAKCSVCHEGNAVGREDIAPPLVHKIYEPSHHGDEAFQRAVAIGVRQHHWPFGDMPPVEGLTRGDVAMIIAYVRELQRANGID